MKRAVSQTTYFLYSSFYFMAFAIHFSVLLMFYKLENSALTLFSYLIFIFFFLIGLKRS